MKYILFIAACILGIGSCKKEEKSPMCYWTVNGESFQSNITKVEQTKDKTGYYGPMDFKVGDDGNGIQIGFNVSSLPTSGSFILGYGDDLYQASMTIHYKGGFYVTKRYLQDSMHANSVNRKSHLQIQNVWFRGHIVTSPDDSILVSGDFYAP